MEIGDIRGVLAARGWGARVIPWPAVVQLTGEVRSRHARGELDSEFFDECLAGMRAEAPADVPHPRAVILLAMPHPACSVRFLHDGRPLTAIVPPTFLRYSGMRTLAEEALRTALAPAGWRLARCFLPVKLIAVSAGLGMYGRNNICYVPGMGSFHRLEAFVTDADLDVDPLTGPRTLPDCESCSACRRACPTRAIGEDRFLLHAERCLTYLNEAPPEIPFPDWVQPAWHHALVGCLACQLACPANKGLADQVMPGPAFDEEETRLLMAGSKIDELPPAMRRLVEEWDLEEYLNVIPRNLAALAVAQDAELPGSME